MYSNFKDSEFNPISPCFCYNGTESRPFYYLSSHLYFSLVFFSVKIGTITLLKMTDPSKSTCEPFISSCLERWPFTLSFLCLVSILRPSSHPNKIPFTIPSVTLFCLMFHFPWNSVCLLSGHMSVFLFIPDSLNNFLLLYLVKFLWSKLENYDENFFQQELFNCIEDKFIFLSVLIRS